MSISPLPFSILIYGPFPEPAKRSEADVSAVVDFTIPSSVAELKKMFQENPDFNLETVSNPSVSVGWTCMANAINLRDLNLINAILDRDPTIAQNAWGFYCPDSYIGTAALANRDIVQAFLDKGADINTVNTAGMTPLFNSAKSNAPEAHEMTKFLLLRGAVLYQSSREMFLSNPGNGFGLEKIVQAQERNILNAIEEIKKEHLNAHKPLTDLTKEKKIFPGLTGLPDVLTAHIMRFLPEAHLRNQFMINHGYIKGPAAKEEESKESNSVGPSSIPASNAAASSPNDLD